MSRTQKYTIRTKQLRSDSTPKVYNENCLSGETGMSKAAVPIATNLKTPQMAPQNKGTNRIKNRISRLLYHWFVLSMVQFNK